MHLPLVIYNANVDDDVLKVSKFSKSSIVNSPFSQCLVKGSLWKLPKRNLNIR